MIDLTLALPARDKALGAVLAEIAREGSGPIGITPDRALNLASYLRESLIETLVALPKYGTLFLAARSVNRAIAYIRANAECDIDDVELAAATGVTSRTARTSVV